MCMRVRKVSVLAFQSEVCYSFNVTINRVVDHAMLHTYVFKYIKIQLDVFTVHFYLLYFYFYFGFLCHNYLCNTSWSFFWISVIPVFTVSFGNNSMHYQHVMLKSYRYHQYIVCLLVCILPFIRWICKQIHYRDNWTYEKPSFGHYCYNYYCKIILSQQLKVAVDVLVFCHLWKSIQGLIQREMK